jgi:hypothetical protein
VLLVLAGGVAAASDWWPGSPLPPWAPLAGSVVVTTLYAAGLAVRAGGRALLFGVVALLLSAAAAWSAQPVLLSGAAVSTAALGAVLGVLATRPAARFPGVLRETLLAVLVAVVAAFASEAYQAPLSVARTGYLVIGLSLVGALAVAYRLGDGLHGLGGRGTVAVMVGIALLAVSLAYSEALARWGPPGLVHDLHSAAADVRSAIGAVPRPVEVLLGFPALAWGVSMRTRRRQGWWLCAFGATGLAVVAASLLDPHLALDEAALALAYSTVLGLLLGYLVIRVDALLARSRGSRPGASQGSGDPSVVRPEPGRMRALL